MASETKWMAVMVEIETYDGEVQSVLPVDTETTDFFSKEELEKVYEYVRFADDASFDFMWDFQGLMRTAINER